MTDKQENKTPENNDEVRIGVYTCYCGGNISDVVDVEKVAAELGKGAKVICSRTDMAMCSDGGQALIENDIKELGINRVIVGACAPSLHEKTFRSTVTRAGLNPYLFYHVGIREQNSWVHHNDPNAATDKAIRLLSTGLAKVCQVKELDPILLKAEKHALVVGGGVAGLRTALDIARRGLMVTLLEKTPFLGGRVAQLDTVFPCDEKAIDLLQPLIEQVMAHPNITVFTNAELKAIKGYVGDFKATVEQQSRGVSDVDAEAIMAACTQEVPDEFNYGLTQRKVVYKAYPDCTPHTPAVDWANYNGEPITVDGKEVVLKNEPKTFDLHVGAVVVATGFDPYEPREGEYGYKTLPQVVTLPQFIRYMSMNGSSPLTWNGKPVRNVGMIHCVGSREIDGIHEPHEDGQVNDYCSRVCCTANLHMVTDLKKHYPDLNIVNLYEDIRTYGRKHERYYHESLENMVRFIRFTGNDRAEVVAASADDDYPVLIKVRDHLTFGRELEVPVDLVILAVGILPRKIDELISTLKISKGSDRFLAEVHPKLQPVETAVPGVILAGTAQSPMNIQESVAASKAAAAKVGALLGSGQVSLEPFVATVSLDKCDGTGACVEVCEYEDAIEVQTVMHNGQEVRRAVVTPANCSGCGNCVSACPNRAIDVQGWTLGQYEAMVDAITNESPVLMEVMA